MAAPKDNKFWEVRSSHGRKPAFSSPDDLRNACEEYFEWVEANPLKQAKAFAFQGNITIAQVDKMRAMTIAGLCQFIDVEDRTWRNWRKDREDLIPVITRVEKIIYVQKFEGAAAELLNSNIIARDLGLADKRETTGSDGGPIHVKTSNDLDVAKAVAEVLRKGIADASGIDTNTHSK